MKKEFVFAPLLLLIGVLLFLLKATGLTAHIAISVLGIALLIVYSVLTKKDWKLPVVEVLMRVSYGVALISGVLIMKISGVTAIAIVHKASAAVFVVLLALLSVQKLIAAKKA